MPRTPMETYTGQLKKVAGLYRSKTRLNYAQAIVEGHRASARHLFIFRVQFEMFISRNTLLSGMAILIDFY